MRVLRTFPRKCIVTGTENREIQCLDFVQCAALVDTNHGIVNLIMNNILTMEEVTAFIHQVRLNGTPALWMTSHSKLDANRGLLSFHAICV